jgi:hypothetical protein
VISSPPKCTATSTACSAISVSGHLSGTNPTWELLVRAQPADVGLVGINGAGQLIQHTEGAKHSE